jgi:hypothetical protein
MWAQVDLLRALIVLVLLGAGMLLATLLVRPAPFDSRAPRDEPRTRRRSLALRGMSAMTLAGLCSGLAGGLLESATGQGAVVQVLHGIFRVCWLPAYLLRELQLALSSLGLVAFSSQLPELLGLASIPVVWFLVFFGAARWLVRRR